MSRDHLFEQEKLLRKKARSRLVGAIALVLAAIIVIPFFLDDPVHTSTAEFEVPQEPEFDFSSREPITSREDIIAAIRENQKETIDAEKVRNELQQLAKKNASQVSSKPEEPLSKTLVKQKVEQSQADQNRADKPLGTTPKTLKTIQSILEANSGPLKNKKTDQKSSGDPNGIWATRVGVFRDHANAQRLIERLKKSNYPAFIQESKADQFGTMYRVAIGPYTNREAAEKILLETESKIGIKGIIVSYPE